ncbi:AAA family ATPase [Sphingobacterium sp. DK4209]|uniref:AAA family ATPase n=1 Tax=Sphingobacterium zhuxiongii TaxID=2662364 RepID=A0A5Q0QFM4_9SPHI|nr:MULTISPECIES: ATP-binding protein [unclassified Sphingobacterium]MVZ67134.1 AAA family ATPase [Sphingobacterium sp. DK4209]QGA26000.1 AAA family ATPase [Sphingobacterium sp. dk4302]
MNIQDLIIKDKEPVDLNDVFLSQDNRLQIDQLIKEQLYVEHLQEYGLPVNNKVLLFGSSGCGKTTTAKAIANAIHRPLIVLNLSNIINSRIGETSQNIKQVFDRAIRDKAVLFLDEFDQIGKARGEDENDVGEMRRLVNTMIQLIDYLPEQVMLICATNHIDIIDFALIRRFQLKISFEMPTKEVLDHYYDKILARFPIELQQVERRYHISFAEAKDYAYTLVKANLIRLLEERS